MTIDRILVAPSHASVEELASVISSVIDDEVKTILKADGPDVSRYFEFVFMDPDLAGERLIRGHHGFARGIAGSEGGGYTYLATDAQGSTDRILKALGERFGGNYLDEETGEQLFFCISEAPTPR